MAFQIVGQRANTLRGPGELLQRCAELLLRRSVRSEQRRISAVHRTLDGGKRAMQSLKIRPQLGYQLDVDVAQQLFRVLQRLVEGLQVLLQIVADSRERELIDFVENTGELRLEVDDGARNHRQLRGLRAQVDLHFGRVGKVVECDIQLPGDEVSASKLAPQTAFLDQALQQKVAFALVFFLCTEAGPLFRARDQTLGVER